MAPFPVLLAALTHAASLAQALQENAVGTAFDLDAVILSESQATDFDFAIQDASGAAIILPPDRSFRPRPGARIRARGKIERAPFGHAVAACERIDTICDGTPPPVETASFDEILSGERDARPVRTTGLLRDYFLDEIDPKYLFLILTQGNRALYATTPRHEPDDLVRLDSLVGHELTLSGLCDPHPSGLRRKIGRILRVNDLREIPAFRAASADPFDVPRLDSPNRLQPADLAALGRRRISGRVLAVWQNCAILIRTPDGSLSRVDLAKGDPPSFDDPIEVVGFPETDFYRVNFARAIWRPTNLPERPPDVPRDISADSLMTDIDGKKTFNADFHGKTVRLRGTVRSLPRLGLGDGRLLVESANAILPVEIGADPTCTESLAPGSVVDVTGVCVTDLENGRPNLVFPHIKEVLLVVRKPGDIAIVRNPPWWTPTKFLVLIGSLVLAIAAILAWNRSLRTLARRRGKALADEELGRLASDLKVIERTRLAVELHDSVAQNLTGVSMEIDTALRGDEPLPTAAAQHMGRALRTIDSCRGELRNCLWDLRSQALEETDMNKAIRLTLSQTIGKADLAVRFNVPRSRFTDNTAHAILRIIRELAANAVRHGNATEIKIAGSLENDVLKFSVRDNGRGFDPDACPGVLDGHFGLQGVRERVASFEGDVQIESAPGKGTDVVISINAPQTEDETKI